MTLVKKAIFVALSLLFLKQNTFVSGNIIIVSPKVFGTVSVLKDWWIFSGCIWHSRIIANEWSWLTIINEKRRSVRWFDTCLETSIFYSERNACLTYPRIETWRLLKKGIFVATLVVSITENPFVSQKIMILSPKWMFSVCSWHPIIMASDWSWLTIIDEKLR